MAVVNATNFPYEIHNVTSADNILEFVQGVNNLTGQWFMLGMLLAGFVILFVTMRPSGNKDALMGSSFFTVVMAIFFRTLEFISNAKLIVIIIVFAIIFVITTMRKE